MISSLLHLIRLSHIGFVLAREGALALIDPQLVPLGLRGLLKLARLVERKDVGTGRLAAALTRLGPSYVKFGQFLATRPDLVGMAAARDLESLQDRMPPFAQEEAEKAIEQALGKSVRDMFERFGPPVAAASIAQVHRGRLLGGDYDVAVKVLRPGVRARFLRDLEGMRFSARMAERWLPASRRLRPREVVETLARSVAVEMDLRLEAAALSELIENTKEDPGFRAPKPDWEHTARDVMTSEWIEGTPLSDMSAIEAAGHDRVALSQTLIQTFLRHAIRDGFFHADMHGGNLFVDGSGQLVAVDFGIMGRLGFKERRFLAEILNGFITRNYRRVAQVHFDAGYVPPHHSVEDFAQAIRAIGEPIHDRPADQISMAKLLTLLFEITALFDMETRPELVMLQKTMVVVEGVARKLDPKLDMWRTAEPVVRDWVERHLGPIGALEQAGHGAVEALSALSLLPDMVRRADRALDDVSRIAASGITLTPGTIESIAHSTARRVWWGNAALWVIAGALVALIWKGL